MSLSDLSSVKRNGFFAVVTWTGGVGALVIFADSAMLTVWWLIYGLALSLFVAWMWYEQEEWWFQRRADPE